MDDLGLERLGADDVSSDPPALGNNSFVEGKEVFRPLFQVHAQQNVCAGTAHIRADQQRWLLGQTPQCTCQVDGDGGFAHATLWRIDCDSLLLPATPIQNSHRFLCGDRREGSGGPLLAGHPDCIADKRGEPSDLDRVQRRGDESLHPETLVLRRVPAACGDEPHSSDWLILVQEQFLDQ